MKADLSSEELKMKKCEYKLVNEKKNLVKHVLSDHLSESEISENELYIRMCNEVISYENKYKFDLKEIPETSQESQTNTPDHLEQSLTEEEKSMSKDEFEENLRVKKGEMEALNEKLSKAEEEEDYDLAEQVAEEKDSLENKIKELEACLSKFETLEESSEVEVKQIDSSTPTELSSDFSLIQQAESVDTSQKISLSDSDLTNE